VFFNSTLPINVFFQAFEAHDARGQSINELEFLEGERGAWFKEMRAVPEVSLAARQISASMVV
jgi:hypothetical protein